MNIKELTISPQFRSKLRDNFHELTHLEKILYIILIRPLWPKSKRFFFEGSWGLLGQMYIEERELLYQTIMKYQPRQCFEIGTYTGGGSTLFLTQAFRDLGKGQLISMESDERLFNKAQNYYIDHLPKLKPYVTFVHGDNFEDMKNFIKEPLECLFLDGAEDGQQSKEQYQNFLPYMTSGTILIAHDWNTEKTRELRPLLSSDSNWELLTELKPPESVGLVVLKRK